MSGIYSKKILVIEENQTNNASIVSRLVSDGFDVYHEYDAEAAKSRISELRPNAIVLDASKGMDLLESLKLGSVETGYLPLLYVFVGPNQSVVLDRAISLGIRDHFDREPLNIDALVSKISLDLASSSVSSESSLQQYKLLLVEDDKFLRDLVSKKLMHTGIQLFQAIDGEQGKSIALQEKPDVILLDILLPGIDGFEVLETIRKDSSMSSTIIIMLSNFGQKEDLLKAQKLGANRFLVKSNVNIEEIIQNVRELLTTRKSSAQPL